MGNLRIFLKTEVQNSGILSYIGNKGLTPARYLFDGETFQINKKANQDPEIHHVVSFSKPIQKTPVILTNTSTTNWHLKASPKAMWKTALAIVLLLPGLLLAVFKLAAYLSKEIRENHKLVKECLVPINRELGSVEEPVQTQSQLDCHSDNQDQLNRPTHTVIVHGDGKLKIDNPRSILAFEPRKIILEGMDDPLNQPVWEKYTRVCALSMKDALSWRPKNTTVYFVDRPAMVRV